MVSYTLVCNINIDKIEPPLIIVVSNHGLYFICTIFFSLYNSKNIYEQLDNYD